ncbi:MAG: hypothetical protein WCJ30_02095 [Deltaproteobacteria bacterium]
MRLVLRPIDSGDRRERTVEGIVLAILEGRDGRARLRMGIPTGSGDPVEVRVLLEGIERVERIDGQPIEASSPPGGVSRPATGAHRRATLSFGSESGVRRSDVAPKSHDSRDEIPAPAEITRRSR